MKNKMLFDVQNTETLNDKRYVWSFVLIGC